MGKKNVFSNVLGSLYNSMHSVTLYMSCFFNLEIFSVIPSICGLTMWRACHEAPSPCTPAHIRFVFASSYFPIPWLLFHLSALDKFRKKGGLFYGSMTLWAVQSLLVGWGSGRSCSPWFRRLRAFLGRPQSATPYFTSQERSYLLGVVVWPLTQGETRLPATWPRQAAEKAGHWKLESACPMPGNYSDHGNVLSIGLAGALCTFLSAGLCPSHRQVSSLISGAHRISNNHSSTTQ